MFRVNNFTRALVDVVRISSVVAVAGVLSAGVVQASPASSACPPIAFSSGNLAVNSGFEQVGPNGATTTWQSGDPAFPPAAAASWFMHTDNNGATVSSSLVASSAPGPNGARMLRFVAGGNEGGIYQDVALAPEKSYMLSVWVYVVRGQVAIQSNNNSGGPVAWSTKRGEWEQLHVCNNSQFSANSMVIYNQDARGGEFYVDRVELKEFVAIE